jgi:phosphoribosylanthranilate isomerase
LKKFNLEVPWFLAGGLDEYNIKKAISLTSAPMVDVSSGVEAKPGKKCTKKIAEFIRKVNEFK